jgi:hypothetical protein
VRDARGTGNIRGIRRDAMDSSKDGKKVWKGWVCLDNKNNILEFAERKDHLPPMCVMFAKRTIKVSVEEIK